MPQVPCDDVIRIRVDTTWAVLDFIRQLAEQAAAGETRAPANPAQTAIFRDIAPYRLVEHNYNLQNLFFNFRISFKLGCVFGEKCFSIQGIFTGFRGFVTKEYEM